MKTLSKIISFILFLTFAAPEICYSQNWTWTRREADPLDRYMNGSDQYYNEGERLAVDAFGNAVT